MVLEDITIVYVFFWVFMVFKGFLDGFVEGWG